MLGPFNGGSCPQGYLSYRANCPEGWMAQGIVVLEPS